VKKLAQKYENQHNYRIIEINAYDLQSIAEEMQRDDW